MMGLVMAEAMGSAVMKSPSITGFQGRMAWRPAHVKTRAVGGELGGPDVEMEAIHSITTHVTSPLGYLRMPGIGCFVH